MNCIKNCAHAQELITTVIDGHASADERAALADHVAGCPSCAEQFVVAQEIHGDLRRLFAPRRKAAAQLAERVAQEIASGAPKVHMPAIAATGADSAAVPGSWPSQLSARQTSARQLSVRQLSARQIVSWLSAMAAGFLIAVLVFQPWKKPGPIGASPQVAREHEPNDGAKSIADAPPKSVGSVEVEPPVAQLVVATGDVTIRPAADADWSAVSPSTISPAMALGCKAGTTVRTEAGVRCEMQTADGCVIRMNDDSQVTVRSARSLELQKGQVWCSAPDNVAMQVSTSVAADDPPCGRNAAPKERSWTFKCPSNASLISSLNEKGNLRLTAARGNVDLHSGEASRRLPSGETVTIHRGQFESAPYGEDALLASMWIDTLLVKKGHADPELRARVDSLLAEIGHAKTSFLHEQELRGLGEHCVLPLLRYVQSPQSANEQTRRHMAMRIVADLAPPWAVGDLIPLLANDDEEIRYQAAAALRRLTGESQGREPGAWRKPLTDCTPTFASWQTWWQNNRQRYPSPEFTKAVPVSRPMDTKKS